MSVQIDDHSAAFANKNEFAMEAALAHMAQDIEIMAKSRLVPVKHGHLKASGHSRRVSKGKHEVIFDKEYAAKMEFVQFKNYTKPGTGPHYLENSSRIVVQRAAHYFANAARSIGA